MYTPDKMPADLRAAHTPNDLAATARVYLSPTTNLWRILFKEYKRMVAEEQTKR